MLDFNKLPINHRLVLFYSETKNLKIVIQIAI